MRYYSFLIIALLLISISGNTLSARSPFKRLGPDATVSTEVSLKASMAQWLNTTQQNLRQKLTGMVKTIQDNGYSSIVFSLIGLSFIYGLIHSVGPGHGKVIVMSYMLSDPQSTVVKGIAMGVLIAFGEAFSAIVVVYSIFYFALGRISSEFEKIENVTRTIGYSGILLIGAGLLLFRIIKKLRRNTTPESELNPVHPAKNSGFWVAVSLAIIPCPGVMILLIFMLAMKMPFLGIILALFMALGMSITISLFGLVVSQSKHRLVSKTSGWSLRMGTINSVLEITGALLIVLLSSYMLFS